MTWAVLWGIVLGECVMGIQEIIVSAAGDLGVPGSSGSIRS